ncbi:hypothetical protein M404DRAFT_34491 [Pisolithus tinctorius Marx 270]|uniref:Uncharacterized protein n=1 Tax=Pisolithus tinctorius Marx 270 TaxID=870435 RepID=A0A0C3N1S6_PISTI|nr:hypothetical protein M404DRAFT_34491 [Pisolithus tinctorius Marx 270]
MSSIAQLVFPPLPQPSLGRWPANIQAAHRTIKKVHNQALYVLQSDSFLDPTWVSFHIEALASTALPILEALLPSSASHEDEPLPQEWLVGVARLIGQAVQDLQDVAQVVNMCEWQEVSIPGS